MNRSISFKHVAAAVIGLGALVAGTAAQARTDIQFSIGFPVQDVYAQPSPVYVEPQPVYVQPRPVYVEPQPVYVQPRSVYVQPPQVVYAQPQYRRGGDRWDHRGYRDHEWRHRARRDADGDGVPNRYDRAPANPYRY